MNTDETITEVVHAVGHEHVSGTHASTFEVTTDDWLTPAGDCILAVEATRGPAEFSDTFRERVQAGSQITVELLVGDPDRGGQSNRHEWLDRASATHRLKTTGRGDGDLLLSSERSLVCRTSEYTDDRTVAVGCDAAASDFDREAITALAAGAPVVCRLHAHPPQ